MKRLMTFLTIVVVFVFGHCEVMSADTPEDPRLSKSKISIHLIANYTAGAKKIVAAGPPVLKVLDLGDAMRAALRDYKTAYPNGKTVLRIYTRKRYELKDDPEVSARDFWTNVLWPPITQLPEEERKRIDYLEGPNEGDSTPTWTTVEDARWFGKFWVVLAPLIKEHGFLPCVGSIPVGNPPGNPEEAEARLEAFVPALEATQRAGGAWSYHSYTIKYTTDIGEENWYSLRYRRFYDFLRRKYPHLSTLPLILTEGGVDESGNPQNSGFRARGTTEQFQKWIAWFDEELQKDHYVIGVTLFQSGDVTGWPSFDIETIADWLANHLRAAR